MSKVYVVTAPADIRGIYDTWDECKAAVSGVVGAKYQGVADRERAEAMLDGGGIVLPTGPIYAFTDGNRRGGVGIVLVGVRADGSHVSQERSMTVSDVFEGQGITYLSSPEAIRKAQGRLGNVFAELAAFYHVLTEAPKGRRLMIVHDYEGVGAWIQGRWERRNPVVAAIVEACERLIEERRIVISFRHQEAHQKTHVGRDDFASYNNKAEALATEAGFLDT